MCELIKSHKFSSKNLDDNDEFKKNFTRAGSHGWKGNKKRVQGSFHACSTFTQHNLIYCALF